MSITPRVHALVAAVETGRAPEAFEAFYADDVVMQENLRPPTVGKAANRERERGFVAHIHEVHESRARLPPSPSRAAPSTRPVAPDVVRGARAGVHGAV